jgi:large subunit ribosomal protein L29
VKTSEIRDKNDEELVELEKELRDQLIQLKVAQVTRRSGTNTSQFGRLRKDIARVQTVMGERARGIGSAASTEAEG